MAKGWIHGWKKKGWSRGPNKPLKNVDLWKRMSEAVKGHKVSWQWVKGHAGHKENERCDELATNAADRKNNPVDIGFIPDEWSFPLDSNIKKPTKYNYLAGCLLSSQ